MHVTETHTTANKQKTHKGPERESPHICWCCRCLGLSCQGPFFTHRAGLVSMVAVNMWQVVSALSFVLPAEKGTTFVTIYEEILKRQS